MSKKRMIAVVVGVCTVASLATLLAYPRRNHTTEALIAQMPPSERVSHLKSAAAWGEASPRWGEAIVAILLQGAVFVGMILARDVRLEDRVRHLEHSPRCLVNRDVGPITYDVATHQTKAMVAEYRGFLHWHRDVSEKLLSIVLVFGFNLFLAKIIGYFYDYAHGDAWRLCFIAVDVGIAIGFIGLSLIVDGIVLIGAMTDAPGIGRTLDSMIVVLAGVVVLLLDVEPKESSLVSFSLGKDPWLSVGLAGITGVLFLVRWVIRHRTIAELMGERSPRGEA